MRQVGLVAGTSGGGGRHLLLLAGDYCSCPSFQFSAQQLYCKHLLAAKLARALDWVETTVVEDSEVEKLLLDLA